MRTYDGNPLHQQLVPHSERPHLFEGFSFPRCDVLVSVQANPFTYSRFLVGEEIVNGPTFQEPCPPADMATHFEVMMALAGKTVDPRQLQLEVSTEELACWSGHAPGYNVPLATVTRLLDELLTRERRLL